MVKVKQVDEQILDIVKSTLDDNKADDIVVIDLRDKTSLASFMVIYNNRFFLIKFSTCYIVNEQKNR